MYVRISSVIDNLMSSVMSSIYIVIYVPFNREPQQTGHGDKTRVSPSLSRVQPEGRSHLIGWPVQRTSMLVWHHRHIYVIVVILRCAIYIHNRIYVYIYFLT